MHQPYTHHFATWARLLVLSLLLGVGVLASLGLVGSTAHAQPAAASSVSTCDEATLRSAIANAAPGDTITFGCSGDILLSSTLVISTNLTLDGSGQNVTLDGQNKVEVLSVNGGVTFTLNALTIAHGSAPDGSGLFNKGGSVSISDSTFASNSASTAGGGLANGGTLSISNSTFASNSAYYGGGLDNSGSVSISNSTFANNSASSIGGGLLNKGGGTVSISNSIFAYNSSPYGNCSNKYGSITSMGYNLSSDSSCGMTATGDLQNTDPKLASALASNGGPTQTLALLDGSPAIDQIPAASCPATDQRNFLRLDDNEPTCDIGAYESGARPDSDLGLTNMPTNITVNATSSQGATVTYTSPTAVDEDSSAPTVSCTPASGSTFAIGTTKVTCTVSDSDDTPSSVSQSFQVVVKDVTAPTLSLPGNPITVDATSPQGATVTYSVTATDPDNAASDLTIKCSPASGSTFAIGTTTVNCSASDPAGNKGTGSFQVVVKGATAQVSDLITTVNSFHLTKSLQTALDNKLQEVLTAVNGGQTATACSELTDFIGFVQSHTGKGLTTSQANQLIAAAKQVQAVLGC